MLRKSLALLLIAALLCGALFACAPAADTAYLLGDVNGDGSVDARDDLALTRYLSGRHAAIYAENADLSLDGAVTVTDSAVLREYLRDVSRPGTRYSAITLCGTDISKYRIVVPDTENDYPRWAAELLSDSVEKLCGVRLSIVTDAKKEKDYEILIGTTDRAQSRAKPAPGSLTYQIYADGTKIVLLGEDFMVGGGVGYLIHTLLETDAAWNDAVSITVPEDRQMRQYESMTPQSAILLIGDGMGENAIRMACAPEATVHDPEGNPAPATAEPIATFWAEQLPYHGMCTTHNALGNTTDSAASATALATGWKTTNGVLGMRPDAFFGSDPDSLRSAQNVREAAALAGRATAVLSTDRITGATPNAFLVHHSYRYDYSILREQQSALVQSPLACDVLWCDYDSDNLLPELRETVRSLLANDSGFFLMAEEAMIDKFETKGDYDGTIRGVSRLNDCVAYAALTAVCHPDVAVVITADHECGGLTLREDGSFEFTSDGEHTGVPVPVYAIGGGTERFHDTTVDNTDIAKYIASIFGAVDFGG